MTEKFDLAVVGAGIVGLSCALAAARLGRKVVVIERDASASGASVRNFGLVTVTGQDRDAIWHRARRSREVWLEVAARAGIRIEQSGLWMTAQRPEAAAVLEAFLRSDTADGCELLTPAAARVRCPSLVSDGVRAVLWSPHELRVESRTALPALADWLAREHGVSFRWNTLVSSVETTQLETSRGPVLAAATVVCPGDDVVTLFPERLAVAGVGRCQLQMLRLESPGFTLPGSVMSDLSLVRYAGFARLPEAAVLRQRLESEQAEYFLHGIHLIVAQGSDGSLVVGDSHQREAAAGRGGHPPYAEDRIEALLLREYRAVTGHAAPAVRERWSGTYAVAKAAAPGMTAPRSLLVETPLPGVRLVVVTSGVGASTGFAIGEEVIQDLFK